MRKIVLPDSKEFIKLYKEMTNKKVAEYYGVDRSTIDSWREELGIPRKSSRWRDVKDYQLTLTQISLLTGSMLGDGSLKGIENNGMSSFVEGHGKKQKNYCRWKYKVLQPLAVDFVKVPTFARKKLPNNKIVTDYKRPSVSYVVRTMTHPIFSHMEKVWYARHQDGSYKLDINGWRIKCLPENIILNELALSVWWFDDGSFDQKGHRGAVFHTQGFAYDECARLQEILKQNYNIKTSLNKSVGGSIIRIWQQSYLDLMNIVVKYLPCKCMKYKIDKTVEVNS